MSSFFDNEPTCYYVGDYLISKPSTVNSREDIQLSNRFAVAAKNYDCAKLEQIFNSSRTYKAYMALFNAIDKFGIDKIFEIEQLMHTKYDHQLDHHYKRNLKLIKELDYKTCIIKKKNREPVSFNVKGELAAITGLFGECYLSNYYPIPISLRILEIFDLLDIVEASIRQLWFEEV